MNLTYVELFAGAGGMSLGLEMAGWECVAHAEIEPHARAVLRHHWPNTPLYGDVSQLDGRQFKGVTMLTGGSPCQDLSIAGKRAGMADGTRSSLFFEQIRIWEEMEAPLILWENVYGAFSSQDGRDFAAVLSAIVGRAVAVPRDGWRRGGVASGPAGIAAWRVLDAQYFGVPQRRRRVFVLGTRDPRFDPAQVLSLLDGLSGHLASSGEAREGIAADSGTGATGQSEPNCLTPWDTQSKRVFRSDGIYPTLPSGNGGGQLQISIFQTGFSFSDSVGYISDVMPTIPVGVAKGTGSQMLGVLQTTGFSTSSSVGYVHDVMPTITNKGGISCTGATMVGVLTYSTPAIGDIREDAVASTMTKNTGGGGETQNPAFVVFGTLQATDATKWGSNQWVNEGKVHIEAGVPRRLTPMECERLMGWPDLHTAVGVNEKGVTYELADTARYKLCGNGIASPVTAWIGFQLRAAVEAID